MKVIKRIYMRVSSKYRVVASDALSVHSGSVSVFYREAEHFTVEALRLHIANVVGFHLALFGQRWYVVGYYLPPDDA